MPAPTDPLFMQAMQVLDVTAKRIARRLGRRIPLDDLKSLGHPAVIEASRTFDPTRSSFPTYAEAKIRWAIFDGIRRETRWRSAAARAHALAASSRFSEGRSAQDDADTPPTQEAHAARLGELLAGHASAMALGLLAGHPDIAALPDTGESPEEHTARAELARTMRRAVGALPERERALVERHYFGGEQFDQIAQDLGISKSWASRLHAQAMARLAELVPRER